MIPWLLALSLNASAAWGASQAAATADLSVDIPVRAVLRPGQPLALRFVLRLSGSYRLSVLGDGEFGLRVLKGANAVAETSGREVRQWFEAGTYALVLAGGTVEREVAVVLEPAVDVPPGQLGPWPLPLGHRVRRQQRAFRAGSCQPDVWEFDTPCPLEASVVASRGLSGQVVWTREGSKTAQRALLRSGAWSLEQGHYSVEITCTPETSGSYEFGVFPELLLPEMSSEVTAPIDLDVAMVRSGLLEVEGVSASPVKAVLLDQFGRVVAASEPCGGCASWSTLIAASFPEPGRGRLRLEPVDAPSARVRLRATGRRELTPQPLELTPGGTPLDRPVNIGRDVSVLELPARGEMLVVTTRAPHMVGVAVESVEPEPYGVTYFTRALRSAGEVIVVLPLAAGRPHRLLIWARHVDRNDVQLRVGLSQPVDVREADGTWTIAPAILPEWDLGLARPVVDAPAGVAPLLHIPKEGLATIEAPPGLLVCASGSCRPPLDGVTPLGIIVLPGPSRSVRLQHLRLVPGSSLVAPVERGRGDAPAPVTWCGIDLSKATGGPLLLRATSRDTQPGVGFSTSLENHAVLTPMGLGKHSAVTVALGAWSAMAAAWSADVGSGRSSLRLDLSEFQAPRSAAFPSQPSLATLAAGQAASFDLPRDLHQVRIQLTQGLVAAVSSDEPGGSRVTSVVAAEDGPAEETVAVEGDHLIILARQDGHYRLAAHRETVDRRSPIRHFSAPGVARLDVQGTVHVDGALSEPPILLEGDADLPGSYVRRGYAIPRWQPEGSRWEHATLLVRHRRGMVLFAGEDFATNQVVETEEWPVIEAQGPGRFRLAKARALRVRTSSPAVLRLRPDCPLIGRLPRDRFDRQGWGRQRILAPGAWSRVYLAPGLSEIGLSAPPDTSEPGLNAPRGSPPTCGVAFDIAPVEEWLGSTLRLTLAGEERRTASFAVASRRLVTIRLTSQAMTQASLFGEGGLNLGAGRWFGLVLEEGNYFVELTHPPGDPAEVGLDIAGPGLDDGSRRTE